jgi:hypothetical protein
MILMTETFGSINGETANLFTDLPGDTGFTELAKFAHAMGLKPAWLQCPSTYKEHYTIWGTNLLKARVSKVPVVDAARMHEILRAKKTYFTNQNQE